MRRFMYLMCIFILLISVFESINAQPHGRIQGRITDKETGKGLPWVNIAIDGTRLGTASDENGNFVLEKIPVGTYRLAVTMLGYRPEIIRQVQVKINAPTNLEIRLVPRPLDLGTVTVTGEREKKMVEQLNPSIKALRANEIRNLAGGGEDLFRTIQALPGVTTRNDFSTQFYVRGGTPDQNLILVDNTPIFNPYRMKAFGGPVSMFNPDIVSYVELLPGGFPAEYGDKLSSVVVVENKDGDRFNHHYRTSLSLIDMKVLAEGPLPGAGDNGSWILTGRRTYYDLFFNHLDSLPRGTMLPFFRDIQGKIVYDLAPNQKLLFNFLDSKEGMELKDLDVDEGEDNEFFKEKDTFNFKNQIDNRLLAASWINAISDVTLSNLNLSHLKDTWNFTIQSKDDVYDPTIDMRKLEIKEDLTHYTSPKHTIQGGLNVVDYIADIIIKINVDSAAYYADNPEDHQPEDSSRVHRNIRLQNASSTAGFYIQDEWKIIPNIFAVKAGLRTDYATIAQEWNFSPRISASYRLLHNFVARAGWGFYYQSPNFVSLFERFEREIEWNLFETIKMKPEKAIHYLAGLEWEPHPAYTTKLEGYYKNLDQLIVATDSSQKYIPNNSGKGYTYGLEAFLQKKPSTKSRFSGWLSYSYSVSKEKSEGVKLHFRDFDQTHSANAVLRYRPFGNFIVDTQCKYAGGFPWTPIQKDAYGNPLYDEHDEILEGEINSQRYPHYSRWDVRLNWEKKYTNSRLRIYVEVTNVLNRKNVYKYYWTNDHRTRLASYMLPRMPFFGIIWEM